MAARLHWSENYIPEPNSGCWIWLGVIGKGGYGVKWIGGRRGNNRGVHRLMYELHKGKIPTGLGVLHRCDNPACCNPDHLFLGTNLDNGRDRACKGRNPDQCGEKGPSARLTSKQVDEIRRSPKLQRELAQEYGVVQSHISKIQSGQRW